MSEELRFYVNLEGDPGMQLSSVGQSPIRPGREIGGRIKPKQTYLRQLACYVYSYLWLCLPLPCLVETGPRSHSLLSSLQTLSPIPAGFQPSNRRSQQPAWAPQGSHRTLSAVSTIQTHIYLHTVYSIESLLKLHRPRVFQRLHVKEVQAQSV